MFAAKDARGPKEPRRLCLQAQSLGLPLLLKKMLSTPASDVFVPLKSWEFRSRGLP